MRLALLATAFALSVFASTAPARTWSETWKVGAHPRLHVQTTDGHVTIHRGAPGRASAVIEYTVRVWGLHTQIREPMIQLTDENDSLTVAATTHSGIGIIGGMTEKFTLDVTVPPSCTVDVRSGDGAVDVDEVDGGLDIRTGDGHIHVGAARGGVRLWTGDGAIEAAGIDGALDAHTGDGRMRVTGRFDALTAHSGDGHIEAVAAAGSRMGSPWQLTAGDGGIELRIPRDLQALLDAESGDGGLHVELPIAHETRHHALRGQLNGGTVPLRVHTGDGSITLGLSD